MKLSLYINLEVRFGDKYGRIGCSRGISIKVLTFNNKDHYTDVFKKVKIKCTNKEMLYYAKCTTTINE